MARATRERESRLGVVARATRERESRLGVVARATRERESRSGGGGLGPSADRDIGPNYSPTSRDGSSGGLLPSAGGDPCLVNAAAEVRTESRAPDVQRIRRHRDDAHGLDLGAGVQIEIPGLAAVEGAVDAADAGVEVATDGESSIGIEELNRSDGERRFKNAAAPSLATIGGAVDPAPYFRRDRTAGDPSIHSVRERNPAAVEDRVD